MKRSSSVQRVQLDEVTRPTGTQVIKWIEKNCYVPEGAHLGKQVKLRDWQKDDIRKIYDNPSSTRRAIISFGRKNAKTTLASFLLLCHLCGRAAVPNSQLYSTAQSREQAAVLFSLAAKIVRMSPSLTGFVHIRESNKMLTCNELGTMYRALAADASTAYGLSPIFVVHDELGQVKGPRSELYDAIETAMGAQGEPLSVIISTQAPTDADLLSVLIDDALAAHDPHTVISLYTAPMEDPPFEEATIRKANPAFDDFLSRQEVMSTAADASRMPAREAQYRNLILNQRVEASNPFVTRNVWASCGSPPKPLAGAPCYAGLDLSSVNDLTAFVLIGKRDGVWQVQPTFWLPGEGLAERSRSDHVPYDLWAKQGFLSTTAGNTVDYEFVAKFLKEQFEKYDVKKVAFDRWNMKHFKPWLEKAGFSSRQVEERFEEFGQGTQSMSPALRELEAALLDVKLAHGNHPVLAMCASCAVVEGKDDANRKLSKNKSSGRIDGMVALTMAMGVAMEVKEIDVETLIA